MQRGDAKKAFMKEIQDDIVITSVGVDPSLIERIKACCIYNYPYVYYLKPCQ